MKISTSGDTVTIDGFGGTDHGPDEILTKDIFSYYYGDRPEGQTGIRQKQKLILKNLLIKSDVFTGVAKTGYKAQFSGWIETPPVNVNPLLYKEIELINVNCEGNIFKDAQIDLPNLKVFKYSNVPTYTKIMRADAIIDFYTIEMNLSKPDIDYVFVKIRNNKGKKDIDVVHGRDYAGALESSHSNSTNASFEIDTVEVLVVQG